MAVISGYAWTRKGALPELEDFVGVEIVSDLRNRLKIIEVSPL
jgi:hypothetical protein